MTDRLYERISLDTERSGSITKQHARLMKVADADDVEVYEERSVSGAKVPFAERPAGGRLLEDLRSGDRVLVTKIDRAARNVQDLLGLVERIERTGATIVFVDQHIDTAGPMGKFLLTLLGAVAELEAAIVAERVRETREAFRAEGRWGGGPVPVGLHAVSNPNGRGLVLRPDPATADLARDVIRRVLAGEPQRSLAPLLGLGEPGFSRWLRNPALAGILPGDDLRVDPDAALISLGEWYRLKEHLRREKAWSKADGYGAALRCVTCGERLYLAKNHKRPESTVYRCARRAHKPGTPGASVVRAAADEHIEREFLDHFGDQPVTEEVTVDSGGERAEAEARARLQIEAAHKALDAAETDEDEDTALEALRSAKRALRAAEGLPSTQTTVRVPTGETIAEVWADADDDFRTMLLLSVGPWTVECGRGLPISEKVHLDLDRTDPALRDYLKLEDLM